MNTMLQYLSALSPAVVAGAAVPFFLGVVLLLRFFFRFDRGVLKKLSQTLEDLTEEVEGLPGVAVERLSAFIPPKEPPALAAAWKRFVEQAQNRYTDEVLPQAAVFFRQNSLLEFPSRRSEVGLLRWSTVFLSILCIFLPIGMDLFGLGGRATPFPIAMFFLLLTLAGLLVFSLGDQAVYRRARTAYDRFLDALDAALPTADAMAGPALLLEATQKNQRAFLEATQGTELSFAHSAERITAALEQFSKGGVLPVLEEAMQNLVQAHVAPVLLSLQKQQEETMAQIRTQQQEGMRALAEGFANQMTGVLTERIHTVADGLSDYQSRIETMYAEQDERHDTQAKEHAQQQLALSTQLHQSMEAFSAMAKGQEQSLQKTAEAFEEAEKHAAAFAQTQAEQNAALLTLSDLLVDFKKELTGYLAEAKAIAENSAAAQRLFGDRTAGLAEGMRTALQDAGKEIGGGIYQAVEDNAEAIAKLTESAQTLREDYAQLFARREESSRQMLEDMDYQLQGMIGRLSEEVVGMLKETASTNSEVLNRYQEETTKLLLVFEEQSRAMGLYAKEINMDIEQLSESLGTAVTDFQEKIRNGLQYTVNDLDEGLAEMAERLSHTAERIGDAVESLPAAIEAVQKKSASETGKTNLFGNS